MLQIQLKSRFMGQPWAYLRPLCGHDEACVSGTSPLEATQFLNRLLVNAAGSNVSPDQVKGLTIGDCDRIFAALYLTYFGEQIESNLTCQICGESYEFRFALPQLLATLDALEAEQVSGPDEAGVYTLPDGRRFRLPTAGDRETVIGLDSARAMQVLLKSCVVEGDPFQDAEMLQTAMEAVGAGLDVDLDAPCAHCGAPQTVQFDMQTFLLRALAFEKRYLTREVHRIASTYGWGFKEILALPREDRRTFVRLIEADRRGGTSRR
jgi:hypothetical protein